MPQRCQGADKKDSPTRAVARLRISHSPWSISVCLFPIRVWPLGRGRQAVWPAGLQGDKPRALARRFGGLFHDLSDEELVVDGNPYWQFFCGFEFFQHEVPIDASMMTRWRQRIGPAGLEEMLKACVCARQGVAKPSLQPSQPFQRHGFPVATASRCRFATRSAVAE